MVSVGRLSPVANNVETTDDFTDCEKSDNLRSGNAGKGDLLLVGVADAGQNTLRGNDVGVLEGSRVAERVEQRLEVGLESGRAPKIKLVDVESFEGDALKKPLTGESCSVHGTPACRVRDQLSSSR